MAPLFSFLGNSFFITTHKCVLCHAKVVITIELNRACSVVHFLFQCPPRARSEHVHEDSRARRLAFGKTRAVDFKCPVCKLQLAPSRLHLDAFVLQILKTTPVETKEVIVDSDGLYHVKSKDTPLRPDQVSFVDLTGMNCRAPLTSPSSCDLNSSLHF
jgi:hypothetical protein